jgi:nucleoid-associated protein YgaU
MELLAANPSIVNPTRLEAGTKIVIPQRDSTLKGSQADSRVSVAPGDTLTKIAQAQYRRATAWRCIAKANPEITDPNRIYEGQQLLLPFSCR